LVGDLNTLALWDLEGLKELEKGGLVRIVIQLVAGQPLVVAQISAVETALSALKNVLINA
jgi:hypothetical protein